MLPHAKEAGSEEVRGREGETDSEQVEQDPLWNCSCWLQPSVIHGIRRDFAFFFFFFNASIALWKQSQSEAEEGEGGERPEFKQLHTVRTAVYISPHACTPRALTVSRD